MQISYLSIPLIQKTEKAFCKYTLEFSGLKRVSEWVSERRNVCVRWSTFYVSKNFLFCYIRHVYQKNLWLVVCYV